MNMRRLSAIRLLTATLLTLLLAACGDAPNEARITQVVQERLVGAFEAGTFELTSLRRLGSGPLSPAADGSPRRIVYFNTVLTFARDLDFSSWSTLNIAAFANLLGATQQGIDGLKQDGNSKGDQVFVHGSASFARSGDDWVPMDAVHPGVGSTEGAIAKRGGASQSKQLIERINDLLVRETADPVEQGRIITEELDNAYDNITVRLDRMDRALIIAGGPADGEYAQVARLLSNELTHKGNPAAAINSSGSADNLRMMRSGKADIALVQNNIAGEAQIGAGTFADIGPYYDLQTLASLFPEPIHIIVPKDSTIDSISDLVGKRVDIGKPNSGSRHNAIALLATVGIDLGDLQAIQEVGLQPGLDLLAAGKLDAVIATIGAPAKALQRAAARGKIRLLGLSEEQRTALAKERSEFVSVVLPSATYPGQSSPVPTVAVTATMVATAGLPKADVERILTALFQRIDFVRAGSAAGSQISEDSAELGLTVPMHPAAIAFFEQHRNDANRGP